MAKKKEYWVVYTPVVELSYGWLLKPDDKFGEPTFKQEFLLSPEQAKVFAEKLESDPRAEFEGKKRKLKGTKVDGKVKFRAKQKQTITWKDKATGEVNTRDASPKVLQLVDGETVEYKGNWVLPGSTGELELEVVPYSAQGGGLSLRLRGVRLHNVIEGEAMKDSWGEAAFDGEEITPSASSSDDSDDDDDNSDDRNW